MNAPIPPPPTTPESRIPQGVWFFGAALVLAILGAYAFDGKDQLVNFIFMLAAMLAGLGLTRMGGSR